MNTPRYILRYGLLGALLVSLTMCIDPFNPKVADAQKDYLVVDGFINTSGVTSIKLSHALSLGSKEAPPAERQARVYVEDERGTQIQLTEGPAGTYTSAARTLDAGRRYRLHFFTRTGQEYASDFTEAKVTPPIDSVTWRTDGRGVTIRVNAHDDSRRSTYYRWGFDETWIITAGVYSKLEYINQRVVDRQTPIYICWATNQSSTIRISNSTRLSQDRIADFPLLTLPPNSPKLQARYSILVTQAAQSREEYEYWELLQKNTENLGSIFDALPSQLDGNVRCLTQPDATALGWVGAYSVTQKRIFIDRSQLPRDWRMVSPLDRCIIPDTVKARDFENYFGNGRYVPLEWLGPEVLAMLVECADCRRYGTNVRPSYWQ